MAVDPARRLEMVRGCRARKLHNWLNLYPVEEAAYDLLYVLEGNHNWPGSWFRDMSEEVLHDLGSYPNDDGKNSSSSFHVWADKRAEAEELRTWCRLVLTLDEEENG